jgi:hypothetical protein
VQELNLKIRGLYSHPSDLSAVPQGALSVADNIVIDKEEIAEPRRGFNRSYAGFSDSSYRANKLFMYQDYLLAHYSTNLLAYYTTQLSSPSANFTGSGAWTAVSGTYTAPTNHKVRAVESNQNLYITSAAGVYKLDAYNATPVAAGAVKGLDVNAAVSASATTWLTNNYRVAYRVVWGYRDANNNLILGAPSQREDYKNTSGATASVDLTITVPAGVSTSWFYQVYRSAAVDNSSDDVTPSDELGLVYEGNPTAGSFSSYTKTFNDAAVNTGTETITIASHGFTTGDMVTFSNSGGALPTGLSTNTNYFVIGATTNTFQVSATFGGAAVNITAAAGGGTHTVAGAQQIKITDITPDELRGATIYTASTQDGLAGGNEQPPLACDIAVYKNHVFYANTTSKNRYYLTLLSVGGTSGVAAADTITVDGIAYTAAAAESVTAREFAVVTGGSASQNIRDTALSLVRVINRSSSSTVYAYYLSGPDDLPGKILLEERGLGDSAFPVISSKATCWSPSLPSSGSSESSTNDRFKHAIYYSKASEPEAVPLTNYFLVGSADEEILRIVPLRDSLFILKTDGVYRLSGEDSTSFRVDLFDSTTRLLAPESAVVLNNQIFCLTDQGAVSLSESGAQVRSRPIESTITSLQFTNYSVLRNDSFGVAYDTERKYILFVPSTSADTTPTQAFVFNTFTNTWTRWVLSKKCGLVNAADDKLYLGDASSHYTNQERKSLNFTDYVDFESTQTISAVSGTTLTISGTDSISVGDVIYQSASKYSIVASVDSVAGTVTTEFDGGFTAASADVLAAIASKIAWVPFTAQNPGQLKHYREVSLLFKRAFVGDGTIVFTSDVSVSQESETVEGIPLGQWGLFGWGEVPWGGGNSGQSPIRVYVPRNKQRCSKLTVEFRHSTGFTNYQLNGLSLILNGGSERVAV